MGGFPNFAALECLASNLEVAEIKKVTISVSCLRIAAVSSNINRRSIMEESSYRLVLGGYM